MTNAINFDNKINELLAKAASASNDDIDIILQKASNFEGLTPQEVAVLLHNEKPEYNAKIFEIAGRIKENIYGNRIVLFAPLYVSDYCINGCTYCGFKNENNRQRRKLTQEEVKKEVSVLEKMGHKRLVIEAGEDPENCPLDYVLECIDSVYKMKFKNGEIRRANVNISAMEVADYKRLKDAQIGTYILFQETYHKQTYEKAHVAGPKMDYNYHITAFDRAMEAGIDDVGAGVLFGLYDYKYEVLALMLHNEHLEENFGVGFHTISVPRICNTGENAHYPHAVSDSDFLRLVAILRLAVPFTGMIVSTREEPNMRKQLVKIGISQMSAGSRTQVGGYTEAFEENNVQFTLSDHREARDVFYWLMEEGILPSFCTACYRSGRSGTRFMQLAKTGNIKDVCIPNGLLTLKEYALDYGDERFKNLANKLIDENLNKLDNHEKIKSKLASLSQGERDVFI